MLYIKLLFQMVSEFIHKLFYLINNVRMTNKLANSYFSLQSCENGIELSRCVLNVSEMLKLLNRKTSERYLYQDLYLL